MEGFEIIDPRFHEMVLPTAPLDSPNDMAVKSDVAIWFSDPPCGIQTDYEGGK